MKRIDVSKIVDWKVAKKTKNIKAKPLISIMVDRSVLSKFLVDKSVKNQGCGIAQASCRNYQKLESSPDDCLSMPVLGQSGLSIDC